MINQNSKPVGHWTFCLEKIVKFSQWRGIICGHLGSMPLVGEIWCGRERDCTFLMGDTDLGHRCQKKRLKAKRSTIFKRMLLRHNICSTQNRPRARVTDACACLHLCCSYYGRSHEGRSDCHRNSELYPCPW
jgi:hypothetical protein